MLLDKLLKILAGPSYSHQVGPGYAKLDGLKEKRVCVNVKLQRHTE